ncbi:MAG: T9SS C-terminal target domain-containing protein [Bacteroidetes bacterium]|nr:MAG: T9SS C-terminal target domain-containing protein [Bacteroidota bacterium]
MSMQLHLHPLPHARQVEISYCLYKDAGVELTVYDGWGKKVDILFKAHRHKGQHKHTWTLDRLASGLYFVRLHSPGRQLVKKVLLQ